MTEAYRGAHLTRPEPCIHAACRVGAGQVLKGLDEGLLTMQPGGIRRLYIPGDMAFPKGLKAAPGRCVRAWVIYLVSSLQRVWGLLIKCTPHSAVHCPCPVTSFH